MQGPYAWVPPTYWQDFNPQQPQQIFGQASGFATEISPGAVPLSQDSLAKIVLLDEESNWPLNEYVMYHTGA